MKEFPTTVFALLDDYLWSKLTTDMYFNKVFYLKKSWGVKIFLKIGFLAQFRSFLNSAIKTVAYLMHHPACHHSLKVQTKLTNFREFWPKDHQKLKMTVSTGTKTFKKFKIANYRSDIAKTCSLCVLP